jgi:hypothetical protein
LTICSKQKYVSKSTIELIRAKLKKKIFSKIVDETHRGGGPFGQKSDHASGKMHCDHASGILLSAADCVKRAIW